MQIQKALYVLFALFFIFNNLYSQQFPLPNLDEDIQNAMKDFNVPGMAVGIVKNDTIVYQKGFGVKNIKNEGPIDINTIFGLGSTTKTFTSGLAAILVAEGIINWDDKVILYLPEFELYNQYVTTEVTIRDLLSHRVGVEAANILWLGSKFSREEIIKKTKYLKPEYDFRSKYLYNNIMILTAGYLMGKATGKTWDSLINEKIFKPLEMKSSITSIRDLENFDNIATPHIYEGDRLIPISWGNIDNIGPAGSINSNLVDMLKWVRLHLNGGKLNDVTLWNKKIQKEIQTSFSIISTSTKGSTHFRTYGLGWNIWDFKGKVTIWHNGMCDGFYSLINILPEEKLGIVILQNVFHPKFAEPLMLRIIDAYLDVPKEKWWKLGKPRPLREMPPKKDFQDYKEKELSLTLSKYTGRFENEMFGDVAVVPKERRLYLHFDAYPNALLHHKSNDIFIAEFTDNIPFMFSRYVSGDPIEVEFRIDRNKIKEIEITRFGIFKR
jgi:CubicO group peptidase (beta-lactamase class C family)